MLRLTTARSGERWNPILSKLKPEAAYFAPADPSQIVESVEPFFRGLNASTELVPVMNAHDLRQGLAKVGEK